MSFLVECMLPYVLLPVSISTRNVCSIGTDGGRFRACPFVSTHSRSVSPNRKKNDNVNMNDPSIVGLAPGGNGMFGGGARAFKDMFDEAMQGGCVEVR